MEEAKVSIEKAALRSRFRALRGAREERADAAIIARLLALPETAGARVVMAFWPLPGEVDLRPFVVTLAERGVAVALPVVIPGALPGLAARRFVTEADLAEGRWGLREPAPDAPAVDPATIDVVVVPALALGRDGSRLGYGGGYYDAFLPTTPALRVGVAPHACLVAALPTEAHDTCLDAAVTDRETIRFRENAG